MAINGGEEYDLTGVDLSAKTDDGEYDLTGIDLGEAESKKKTVSQPPLGGSPQPLQEAQDISATSASATLSSSAKTPFEQKPPYFVPEKLIVEGVPKEENLAREYEISQNNLVGAQKGVDWATGRDEELKGSLDPEARKSAGKYTQDAAIKLGQAQFKADENIAKLKEAIKGDLDYLGSNLENFTRKSQEDDVIADEVKIDEYAREQARKKGLPEDGYYKNFLYNNAKAEVAQKIIEPDVLKEREKLFKEKTGKSIEDAFGEDFTKGFTKAQEIEATAKTQINSVAQEVNALAKTETEEIAKGVNSQIEQLNAAYQQQAAQVTDQSQADALYQEYTANFNRLQANFLDAQNQINGKYNQRLRRQADEIEKVANQKWSEEAEKYKKDYKVSPDLLEQLKTVSQEAYKKVVGSKEKVKEVRDLYTPAISNYYRSTVSSLGRSLGNLSETMGYDYGKVLGDYMENTYQVGSAELNSWKDLLDASKLAKSAGQLTGAMLPSMGAAAATTIATQGLGAPEAVSMLAGGLAAWTGESMDMAGNIERQTFAETGDANKALQRSKRMWDAQIAAMPLYSLEGLPFMKGMSLSKNVGKRMIGGAVAEYVPEVIQEYTQNKAEEVINKDKEFSEIFDTASWKEFGHTALNVAPVAILGAGGQIRGEKSEQEKINDEAKSFALKSDFIDLAPDQRSQFISDIVREKGKNFASAYISNLYTNGTIPKSSANQLVKAMGVALEVDAKAQEYGFDETQKKVFTAFKYKLINAQEQAANETDPILKQAADAKVKEIEEQTVNFASGKEADYVVMTYPNGEQYVLSVGQGQSAAKNPKLQQAVADGTIKLEGSGKGVDVVNLIGENIKQSKKQKDAKENQIGLPSEVGERQEPVKAEPIEEGRGTEVAPSGVLEKQEEKVGKKLIPEGETFIDVPKEDIVQAEDYFEKPVDEKLTSDMSIEQRIEMVDKNKDNIKDEEVKISDIIPTQNILDKRAIDKRKTDKEPVLIKWKGEYYVLDGHHRIVSDINGGKKSVKAKVIDFSEDVAGSKSDAMQQDNTGNNAAPAQTTNKVFNKEEFIRDIDTLERQKANGSKNIGLYSFKDKFVKRVKSRRKLSNKDLDRLRDRVKGLDNVFTALEIIDLPDGSQAIVMDKASGKIGNELTQSEIDNIPQEHWNKFEKTIRELSNRGISTDLTKKSNVLYDKDKGFQFIDLEGASVEGDATNKFFIKDGKEYYYSFERYPFFPKPYKSAKEIFTEIGASTETNARGELKTIINEKTKKEDSPQIEGNLDNADKGKAKSAVRATEKPVPVTDKEAKKQAREAKKQQEEELKKRKKDLANAEPNDIKQLILQYFYGGGRILTEDFKNETGFGTRGGQQDKVRAFKEFKKRIWAHSGKSPSMDDLVMQFQDEWKANYGSAEDQQAIRNEIIGVLKDFDSKSQIERELERLFSVGGKIVTSRDERNQSQQEEDLMQRYAPESAEEAAQMEAWEAMNRSQQDFVMEDDYTAYLLGRVDEMTEEEAQEYLDNEEKYNQLIKQENENYERESKTNAKDSSATTGQAKAAKEYEAELAELNKKLKDAEKAKRDKLDRISGKVDLFADEAKANELFGAEQNLSAENIAKQLKPETDKIAKLEAEKAAFEANKENYLKKYDNQSEISEAAPEKVLTEKEKAAKELADRIRKKKWGGANVVFDFGLTKTIYNFAVDKVADAVESGTELGKAIQQAVEWIESQMNGKEWDKKGFSDSFSDEGNDGKVPPTEKDEKPSLSKGDTDVSALKKRIVENKKAPKEIRDKIKENGISYEIENQELANQYAQVLIDEIGIDGAVELADSGKIRGATKTFIYGKAIDDAAKRLKEGSGTVDEVNTLVDKLDGELRKAGREISAMLHWYINSPEGLAAAEIRKVKKYNDAILNPDVTEKESTPSAKINKTRKKVKKEKKEAAKEAAEKITEKPKPSITISKDKAQKAREKINGAKAKLKKMIFNQSSGFAMTPMNEAKKNKEFNDALIELATGYIELGYHNFNAWAAKIKEDLKEIGVEALPQDLQEMWDNDYQYQAKEAYIADNAEKLAKKIIARTEKKGRTVDPVKQMINTLFKKVDEKLAKEPKGKTILDKPINKLILALKSINEYRDVWDASKAEVIEKIDAMEISEEEKADLKQQLDFYFKEVIGVPFSDALANKVVKDALGDNIDAILKQAHNISAETKQEFISDLVDMLKNKTGISDIQANQIAEKFAKEYDIILRKKASQLLDRNFRQTILDKTSPKRKKDHEKIADAIIWNNFANKKDFENLFAEKYGLVDVTDPDFIETIKAYVDLAQSTPEGFLRDEVYNNMMQFISWMKGEKRTVSNYALSQFYNNILFGIDTFSKAFSYNYQSMLLNMALLSGKNPKMAKMYGKAMFGKKEGLKAGRTEALMGFLGMLTKRHDAVDTLNLPQQAEKFGSNKLLRAWGKYAQISGKALTGIDLLTSTPQREAKLVELVANNLRKQGVKDYDAVTNEIMGWTSLIAESAQIQAQKELEQLYEKPLEEFDFRQKLNYKARVLEIVDKEREKRAYDFGINTEQLKAYKEKSQKWADKSALFGVPEGTLGGVATALAGIGKVLPASKFIMATFINAPLNMANWALTGFAPTGLARAAITEIRGRRGLLVPESAAEKFGIDIEATRDDRNEMWIKAIGFSVMQMGLAAAMGAFDDDDEIKDIRDGKWQDKDFFVTFNMKGNYFDNLEEKRNNHGIEPFTVYIKGHKVLDYKNSPLITIFGVPAAYMDAIRFHKQDDKATAGRILKMSHSYLTYIREQSSMQWLNDIANAMGGNNDYKDKTSTEATVKYLAKRGADISKGLVMPRLIPAAYSDFKGITDMDDKTATENYDYFTKDVPFLDAAMKGETDAVGRPIKELFDMESPLGFPIFRYENGQPLLFAEKVIQNDRYYSLFSKKDYQYKKYIQKTISAENADGEVVEKTLDKKQLKDFNKIREEYARKVIDGDYKGDKDGYEDDKGYKIYLGEEIGEVPISKQQSEEIDLSGLKTNYEVLASLPDDVFQEAMANIYSEGNKVAKDKILGIKR